MKSPRDKSKQLQFREILSEVRTRGLLLQADSELPSVVTLIVGKPVKGSWWGHKLGNHIFNTCSAIEDSPEVLTLKLLKRKVTFVHKKLWRSLLVVASSRGSWQMQALGAAELKLLEKIEKEGSVRLDLVKENRKDISALAAKLEARLLILTKQIHTETGAHAKVLLSWESWRREHSIECSDLSVSTSKKMLEDALIRQGIDPSKKHFAWL